MFAANAEPRDFRHREQWQYRNSCGRSASNSTAPHRQLPLNFFEHLPASLNLTAERTRRKESCKKGWRPPDGLELLGGSQSHLSKDCVAERSHFEPSVDFSLADNDRHQWRG
jgi:hypothetical protein